MRHIEISKQAVARLLDRYNLTSSEIKAMVKQSTEVSSTPLVPFSFPRVQTDATYYGTKRRTNKNKNGRKPKWSPEDVAYFRRLGINVLD
jgi:hypothetical protein